MLGFSFSLLGCRCYPFYKFAFDSTTAFYINGHSSALETHLHSAFTSANHAPLGLAVPDHCTTALPLSLFLKHLYVETQDHCYFASVNTQFFLAWVPVDINRKVVLKGQPIPYCLCRNIRAVMMLPNGKNKRKGVCVRVKSDNLWRVVIMKASMCANTWERKKMHRNEWGGNNPQEKKDETYLHSGHSMKLAFPTGMGGARGRGMTNQVLLWHSMDWAHKPSPIAELLQSEPK